MAPAAPTSRIRSTMCWRSPASSKVRSVRARDINPAMKMAAAKAIAGLIPDDELNEENILPKAFDPRVADAVAAAVAQAARESGVARV